MSEHQLDTREYVFAEADEISVSIGKIEENFLQLTASDTGWNEEEKERMRAFGYDSLDMVRAWYS